MSNSAALRPEEGPSTVPAPTAASAASSSAAAPPQAGGSPSYTFSAAAVPFIPSFMRTAPLQTPQPTPGGTTGVLNGQPEEEDEVAYGEEYEEEEGAVEPSTEGSEQNYRQHFSKQWMLCLEQMQGQEVGMLMEMMPLDIQDLYFDKLSDEYLHHDHEHKDTGVHALRAAQKMVGELSPEQLAHIEEFLVETDALNPDAARAPRTSQMPHNCDGDDFEDEDDEELFMHDDDGMGVEEEEWLLEQMMMAAAGNMGDAAATAPKQRK